MNFDIGIIFVYLNVVLAVFNLIPIHPLDGFKIVAGLLPKPQAKLWNSTAQYGIFFLILLLLPITQNGSIISQILDPVVATVLAFLL